jgi:hypothetical protein
MSKVVSKDPKNTLYCSFSGSWFPFPRAAGTTLSLARGWRNLDPRPKPWSPASSRVAQHGCRLRIISMIASFWQLAARGPASA